MMGRQAVLDALRRESSVATVYGSGTSVICQELMDVVGVGFPEGHLNAESMAALALAGHTVLGFDMVMPLFSVCHEASAMGCNVNWGSRDMMPESGPAIFETADDIRIPSDLLTRPGCAVPLEALRILKHRLGDTAAVCGKVFGSWTQAYHYFGVSQFLMMTVEDPDEVRRILDRLTPVTIAFAQAQLDAGADCLVLADHATRDLCSPAAYEEFLFPLHSRLAEAIRAPIILHICGDTSDRIGMIAETGVDCFHWDTKLGTPDNARALAGERLALMGGISNYDLLWGTPDTIKVQAVQAHECGIDIVGPECAIPLKTPLKNLMAIVS